SAVEAQLFSIKFRIWIRKPRSPIMKLFYFLRLKPCCLAWKIRRFFTGILFVIGIASSVQGQPFAVLKSFGVLTNVTGRNPVAPLASAADGTLYGTTSSGDGTALGTVFKVSSDGSGFTVLKWFTNSFQGSVPLGGLVLSGNTLYGTLSTNGSGSS